eukprot:gene14209-15692_t
MDEFTVADVYEHAAKIGQDIEHMIRNYGEDSVEQLMPKVVFTLEQLEGLAEKVQKDATTINELNAEKEKLFINCKKEAALKRQLEEKVDYLEDLLNEDTKNLQSTISGLTKENEMLKSEVEQLDEEMEHQKTSTLTGDMDLMMKMKATIDTQRDQIRQLSMQSETEKTEIEALNEQTNRLTEINERLRLYNAKLQDRLTKTVEHKVQAEATLASVKIVNKEQRNSEEVADGFVIVDNKLQIIDSSQEEFEAEQKQQIASKSEEKDDRENLNKESKDVEVMQESAMQEPAKKEPVKKDPNRPRYTLAEMQQVLEERNRYHERVNMLEEVLESYVPPSQVRSSTLTSDDIKRRKESKTKTPTKKESKVKGIFGLFSRDRSSK